MLLVWWHHVRRSLLAILIPMVLIGVPLHRGAWLLGDWGRGRGLAILWKAFIVSPLEALQLHGAQVCKPRIPVLTCLVAEAPPTLQCMCVP